MYIIIESLTDAAGNVATIVTKKDTRSEAESTYHMILGAAAVSSMPIHAAAIMTNDMQMIERKAYFHEGGDGENVGNG